MHGEFAEGKMSDRKKENLDGLIIKKERELLLREEIMALSEKHRTAIILHDFNYLSCKEIAEVTGCSEGTVMSRLFHARKRLHKKLSHYFGE